MMNNYDFTRKQITAIVNLLERIEKAKNDKMSNSTITSLQMFTNDLNDFVCTYQETTVGYSGLSIDDVLVKIDRDGNEIDLIDEFQSEIDAKNSVKQMREIKFSVDE